MCHKSIRAHAGRETSQAMQRESNRIDRQQVGAWKADKKRKIKDEELHAVKQLSIVDSIVVKVKAEYGEDQAPLDGDDVEDDVIWFGAVDEVPNCSSIWSAIIEACWPGKVWTKGPIGDFVMSSGGRALIARCVRGFLQC